MREMNPETSTSFNLMLMELKTPSDPGVSIVRPQSCNISRQAEEEMSVKDSTVVKKASRRPTK